MDEEKKRMYYVALTRAMKSEYVLAYDTVANAKIEADYRTIVDTLTKRAAKNASSAGVVGQSDDDDDSSASQSDEPNDTNN
jgi:DNA helicase-2/ATP-dependent DNA helicase PcrA